MATFIFVRLAVYLDRALRENGRSVKQRAMVFAAIEAMANADPVRLSRRY
jgi:hypothetical protein